MLEDPSFQNVVSWGPSGDCFVVKVCVFLLISYTILPVLFHIGYERFHQVYSATDVQAFKFCELR